MALLRKLFYKKPPDGLLEISERVYVFDCCFTTDAWEQEDYKGYVGNIISQLKDHYPDASILIFSFREGESSQIASALSEYDMTIMDYPRHYEGCPLLSMEVIHHFLRSSESWLSLGQQNILLMHCERGGWPVLAFMLATLLIYRKHYTGEYKTLDMVYKQAPRELLHFFSPLNPLPSQLRYLQYVSRRNVATEWPPLDRALTLDCVILRMIPDFDGKGGCCPIFRIYGQDPLFPGDKNPKLLFSTPKRSKSVRHYRQTECELVKIDINCHVQGDIVLECLSLYNDMEREKMMYRAMFNTAFIRSNILMLNRDEIDTLWDAKDHFPKDFRAELLFSEMDSGTSIVPADLSCFEEEGLPIEAFAKVQEMFNSVDWLVPKSDAALNVLQQIAASDIVHEKKDTSPHQSVEASNLAHAPTPSIHQDKESPTSLENKQKSTSYLANEKPSPDIDAGGHKVEGQTFGPRSDSDSQQPSLLPSRQPSRQPSPPSQASLNGFTKSVSSSSVPHQNLSTSEPLHTTHPGENETHLHGSVTSSLPSPLPVDKPSSSTVPENSLSYPIAPHGPQSTPPLPTPTEQVSGIKSPAPPPTSPPPHASSSPPSSPTLPLKNLNTSMEHSSLSQSTLPSHPRLQEITDVKVGPPPPPPPPTGHLTQSAFPPSILPSSQPSKDMADTEVGSSQPLPSPPMGPVTPALKEKRVTVPEPPQPPPLPQTLPSTPTPTSTTDKDTRRGPPPALPLPPGPFRDDQTVRTERTSAEPMAPVPVAPPPPPPPPPPPTPPLKDEPTMKAGSSTPPPPPSATQGTDNRVAPPVPPPPPPPAPSSSSQHLDSATQSSSGPPPPPPPKTGAVPPPPPSLSRGGGAPTPPPPLMKGRSLSRTGASKNQQAKKLKPLHWLKLNRAVQGSLWAEAQKSGEAAKAPEIDISELENLFSASNPNSEGAAKSKSRASLANKPEKVQLIDHRRAYNCEIMLSKVKIPLHELMDSVLSLEDSAMDVDQVDNLIKFCPTKDEMELLKGYKGEKDKLGKCEQFFLELMKVPRTESKLRVFSFKLQFRSQVSDLRKSLNIVNSAVEEIRGSAKLKRIMQTILSLGNALNQGTARGSAVGFRLDSLLKLTETRARNNKMTLMHYLCKVLVDKLPEVLDFSKDLGSLEPASKIQLKFLAEEMQAISKGLEKVVQELSMAENDGPVSENFRKALKEFLCSAEGEARSLASLYSGVGKTVDALILYFGEDPARCPYEQVVSTLLKFVRMFNQAHDENVKKQEAEKKKAEREASNEKLKMNHSNIESEHMIKSPRSVK